MLVAAGVTLVGCNGTPTNTVTVYVSEDQVFSEPILRDFERETGIKVNAVFDTEEAKSTGVMNRLLAEKNNPQADVYWANEPVRADVLKQQGISASVQTGCSRGDPGSVQGPRGTLDRILRPRPAAGGQQERKHQTQRHPRLRGSQDKG